MIYPLYNDLLIALYHFNHWWMLVYKYLNTGYH